MATQHDNTATTTTTTTPAQAAENAHRAWADHEAREESGKPTKRSRQAATKAAKEATAVLVAAEFWSQEEAATQHDSAEWWSDVWADVLAEEKAEKRGMARILERYKPGYQPCVTHNGTKSLNNGDQLAEALEGMEPASVARAAEIALGLDEGFLVTKYARLNPGQMRMNSGNRMRSALKRGDVTIEELLEAIKKAN